MANLGAYQSPWVRIQRLLNAQRQGFEALTDTMADMIDLEAHQRLRERPLEGMERFREVEQRQQPSVRGGRGPMPSLPAPGGPQYEPGGRVLPAEAAPYLREMLPRWQREAAGILPVPGEPGLEPTGGLIPTGEQRMAIGQRALQQQGPTPFVPSGGMLGMAMPVLEQADFPRQLVKEKLIEPVVPDFAMKIPGEALGAALPPGVRDVVGAVGALGGPEVPDVTITDEFVEEAASWILDPLNVLPVIGWGPDIMRAAKAGRPALKALLKKTPQAKAWLDDVIRHGERGGGRVPGVGPEDVARITDPLESAKAKIIAYTERSEALRPGLEAERSVQTAERAAALEAEKTRLLAQGVPYDEAIQQASAKLAGTKATRTLREAIGFTDEEGAAFQRVIEQDAKTYEKVRLLASYSAVEGRRAQPSIFAKMLNGEPVTPAEGTLLRRLFGDEVADAALSVGKTRDELRRALNEAYPRRLPKPGKGLPMEEGGLPGVEYGTKVSQAVMRAAREPNLVTKAINEILEIPRFFTGLYSLLDASWGGRQLRMLATAFVGPRKPGGRLPLSFQLPRVWAKSYWETTTLMFRSSESRAAYGQALRADATPIRIWTPDGFEDVGFGRLWQKVGGPLPEGELEERVVSNLLRKLPGFKQSAEGYTLGIEAAHQSALKDELLGLLATGKKLTMKDVQALSEATTALTGRGNLGKNLLADIATALGWAPKLRAAFWQTIFRLGHPNAKVRSLAARRLAGYLGTGLTMMGVAEVTGAGEVTWNPLNTDFGKIKIKGVRFNVWGPDVVAVRYLAQGIFGYAASPLTGDYKVDWKDSLMRYGRSGANPAVGLFIDWRTGKTYTGERFNLLEWQERLPLAFQDIVDAFELKGGGIEGVVTAAAVAPFVMAGIGVGAYDRAVDRVARLYNEYVDQGKFGKDALYYADEEDLTVKANLQGVPELVQLDSERNMLARAENIEVKKGLEDEYGLPETAQRFNAGDTAVGPQLMKDWRAYRHDVHVAMDARVFGVEFPETEDSKLLHEWLSIDSHDEKYRDSVTREPDYDLVDADSEAAEAKLIAANPRLAAAVEEIISSIDPGLAKLEPELEEALGLKSDSYDIPRWKDIGSEKQKQIEDLQGLVAQFRARLGLTGPVALQQYNTVAAENGIKDGVITLAHYLRPGSSGDSDRQDPQRIKFLIANGEKLAPYFPDMYRSRALQATLPDELREAVILTAVGR